MCSRLKKATFFLTEISVRLSGYVKTITNFCHPRSIKNRTERKKPILSNFCSDSHHNYKTVDWGFEARYQVSDCVEIRALIPENVKI